MPQNQTSSVSNFGSAKVSARKIFIIGVLLPLFAPAFVAIAYSLFFIFNKETRKEGIIILLWAIVVAVILLFVNQFLVANGHPPVLNNPFAG